MISCTRSIQSSTVNEYSHFHRILLLFKRIVLAEEVFEL